MRKQPKIFNAIDSNTSIKKHDGKQEYEMLTTLVIKEMKI